MLISISAVTIGSAIALVGGILLLLSYVQSRYGIFYKDPFEGETLSTIEKVFQKKWLRWSWIPLRWLYINHIYRWIRVLFVRPELSVAVFGVLPAAGLIWFWVSKETTIQPLVLATTFYASVIFFKEIFLSEYPLVDIYPYKHTDGSNIRIYFLTLNNGTGRISNLNLTYRVYDRHGRLVGGIQRPPSHAEHKQISLEPGDDHERIRLPLERSQLFESSGDDYYSLKSEVETPVFVELSATPNIGHRFLSGKAILRLDPRTSENKI
jgi:hypothetical protein